MATILWHDVRSAFRLVRSRAAFAWAVVITVALASGFLGVATNLATALLAPYAGVVGPSPFAVVSHALAGRAIADEEPLAAIRPIAVVLLAAGAMVLVAGCTNLATLSMSHYRTRLAEFAIRASVGGTPRRLVRQLYTEGFVLSLGACVLGGVFAFWTRQVMFSWLSPEQAATVAVGMSSGATFVASTVSLAACAVVFFACARAASGLGLPLLTDERDSLTSAAKGARPRQGLVVVQIAISCVLLVAATLLRDGMNQALQSGPGITANRVAVISTVAPTRYSDRLRGRRFQLEALERVARMPGVMSVAATSTLPLVNAMRTGYSRDSEGPFLPYDTITIFFGLFRDHAAHNPRGARVRRSPRYRAGQRCRD